MNALITQYGQRFMRKMLNLEGTSHLRDEAVEEENILENLEVDVYDLF